MQTCLPESAGTLTPYVMHFRQLTVLTLIASALPSMVVAQMAPGATQTEALAQPAAKEVPPDMMVPAREEPSEAAAAVAADEPGIYQSPTGLYSMPVPVRPALGGQVRQNNNLVVFMDGFNTHISIAVVPLDASQRWELATRGKKEYLTAFLSEMLLNDYRQADPRAGIEVAKFAAGIQDGAILASTLHPGGGNFLFRTALFGQEDTIAVAKRGNLLFLRNEILYILSMELGERSTERSRRLAAMPATRPSRST